MANELYERIKALVHIKDDPAFQYFDPVKKTLVVVNELTAALLNVYEDARDHPADLAEALVLFHHEYFVPIDLPLNDYLETFVEAQLASLYAPAAAALSQFLRQKLPNPEAPDGQEPQAPSESAGGT